MTVPWLENNSNLVTHSKGNSQHITSSTSCLSEMVWLLGEVPIWFGCWGKSRYGLVVGGSPEMWRHATAVFQFVTYSIEFPYLDLAVGFSWQTEHRIPRWKRAQKIPRWKMRSNPMLENALVSSDEKWAGTANYYTTHMNIFHCD